DGRRAQDEAAPQLLDEMAGPRPSRVHHGPQRVRVPVAAAVGRGSRPVRELPRVSASTIGRVRISTGYYPPSALPVDLEMAPRRPPPANLRSRREGPDFL